MKPIPFAKPLISKREINLVKKALKSGWLTTGKVTSEFEEKFKQTVKSDFALGVNSATAGLHLALESMKIGPGDKVITSPYTFTATAEVIRYLGAEPLFVDILSNSPLIDPNEIQKISNDPKIKAVIPVHIAGECCDLEAINQICAKHNWFCLEDAAHTFPAQNNGKYIGTQSDVGVYSFYATKTITTAEGGMIVTNNEELANRMKSMRLHGINRDVWDRYSNNNANWEYDIIAPGYKYNLTDIASSIGIAQLNSATKMMQMRKKIAAKYNESFQNLLTLQLPYFSQSSSWHLYMIQVRDQGSYQANFQYRNKWIKALANKGIGTSVHYKPLHLMTYYKERYNFKPEDFPNALDRYSKTFSIPIYQGMKNSEIQYIIKTVKALDKNGI